jgi:hypothetical protein
MIDQTLKALYLKISSNFVRLASFPARHALSVSLTVLFAIVINHYFSFSKEGWMILSAFLVCQTTRGAPLKQSIIYLFIIFVVVCLLSSNNMALMRDRALDTVIGGLLGILFSIFVFPVRVYAEFCLGVTPVLQALIDYSQVFSKSFMHRTHRELLVNKKWQIEVALSNRQGMYPEWVYEVGFNPGLRSGYRFFLISLERVTEIFFSLTYLMGRGVDTALLSDFSADMTNVMQKNEALLQTLISYLTGNKIKNASFTEDFTSDMTALEKTLNQFIPGSLELLDISPDYMILTALVRDLKDLRELLLQLVLALP